MIVNKVTIDIFTNYMIKGDKKPTQDKIGTITLDWSFDLGDLDALLEVLSDKMFARDPVTFEVKVEGAND